MPPLSRTPSSVTKLESQATMALSKSLATAIKMLMATITNGNALNQWERPTFVQLYLSIMKPMHPAVAAYTFA